MKILRNFDAMCMCRRCGGSIVSPWTVSTRSIWNTREGDRRMTTRKTFLHTASCGLLVALVCGSAMVRAQPAVSATSDAFVHPTLIVSVSWLMQRTTDAHLRLVDARPT